MPRRRRSSSGHGSGRGVRGWESGARSRGFILRGASARCGRSRRPSRRASSVLSIPSTGKLSACRACYFLRDRGWGFKLFGVELGFAFLLPRLELVPVRSSLLDPLATTCVLAEGIGSCWLELLEFGFLATTNLCLHLRFEFGSGDSEFVLAFAF
jgi:hypothetical protein